MLRAAPRRVAYAAAVVALSTPLLPNAEEARSADRDEAQQASMTEGAEAAAPTLDFSGLLEVEAFAGEDFMDNDVSDLLLATVELGAEARITRMISANVLLLFEEDTEEDIEVDEATITLEPPQTALQIKAGRFYVPFGAFETAFIDDPLPLEIGETRKTAVRAGVARHGFRFGAWAFKGDTDDDAIGQYGLDAGYRHTGEALTLATGVSAISSIADADVLSEAISAPDDLEDTVAGLNAHAHLEAGDWAVTGEYVSALDAFDAGELAFDGRGAQPGAGQVELAYALDWRGTPVTTAVGLQGTDEALALGLPEERALAGITAEPWRATSISLQLAHDRDYDRGDGGTGEDSNTATVQLAVSF